MNMKIEIIFLLCILPFAGIVKSQPLNAESDGITQNLPSVACHYETTVKIFGQHREKQTMDWYLWREPDRIETQESIGETGEIWHLGRDGGIFYYRVFHRDMQVIEHTTGDLHALNSYPDWNKLTHVFDPNLLAKLKHTGTKEIVGLKAQQYQGQVNGIELKVLWLNNEQIPALVRQIYPDQVVILSLKEIHSLSESPLKRYNTIDYKHLDYADIGDRQSDPFLKNLVHNHKHSD